MHKRCNKIGIIWASTEFILCLMILNNNFIQAISLFYYNSFISSLCSYVHMFIIKFLFSYHICCSFFLFLCYAFHAFMQCTHCPPFLKCVQITSGYLLDFDILLSFKDDDYDFCDLWDNAKSS